MKSHYTVHCTCWRLKRSSWSKNRWVCGGNFDMVSAGAAHTVLLRSDGCAVAFGWNHDGSCSIPPLDENLTYTQVSAGGCHTVLLRSDGFAVACGLNNCRQLNIPPLDPGVTYTQVSAGDQHTVLLVKWWQRGCLRTKCFSGWTWTMWHSTFGWGSDVHPGICRCCSYSACPKWWQRSCLWMEWMWRMQHSTFGWGCDVHPGFCRFCPYSSPPKWWLCSCLWPEWLRTMCHSVFEVMESVVAF